MAESKLSLIQKENLHEIIQNLSVFFDKFCRGCKERDVVTNAWEEIANSLEFLRNGTYYISKA